MTANTQTLYRPVGLRELELIIASGMRRFPPRQPEQPIFYPVLSADYAREIAQRWNLRDEVSGFAGFVTAFDVDADYVSGFEPHTVGARRHVELWVPAEDLETFCDHIRGRIRVGEAYFGERYAGPDARTLADLYSGKESTS